MWGGVKQNGGEGGNTMFGRQSMGMQGKCHAMCVWWGQKCVKSVFSQTVATTMGRNNDAGKVNNVPVQTQSCVCVLKRANGRKPKSCKNHHRGREKGNVVGGK